LQSRFPPADTQDFFGAFFLSEDEQKKPGFPLQVLGSADALPVGFPLQSALSGLFPIGMDCSGRYRAPGIPRAPTGFSRSRATYFEEKIHREVEKVEIKRQKT
jgi:hypothetical protein